MPGCEGHGEQCPDARRPDAWQPGACAGALFMRAGGGLPGGFRWGAELRPRGYRLKSNQTDAAALMRPMPRSNIDLPRARLPCWGPSPLYQTAGRGYADARVISVPY